MWIDLGPVEQFMRQPLSHASIGTTRLVVSHVNGELGVLSGTCNHAGGPLADGTLDGEYITCPWHNWKYHCRTGLGEPGFEADAVPRYDCKVEDGRLLVSKRPVTKRTHGDHPRHALARKVAREPGPVRVVGISTTNMDEANPRYSTSDALLSIAMEHAASLGAEARTIHLAQLRFRACEGYYSKSAHACTWPCSITQMDPDDQLDTVYEAFVHWADAIVVATPIRWGNASALYYKMVERLNCVQNQLTIANRVLMRNKVAAFIITGGQDNVQGVAGQLLGFFAEIGCQFPQFPYIAHSRGWTAEDMEQNVEVVKHSEELREGARALVTRAVDTAYLLLDHEGAPHTTARGGRKAHRLALDELGDEATTSATRESRGSPD
jgi:multimeric flavodoxin WrbA/nitrite reductase/ring-hydroxylating ferredoxin subunit